MKRPVQHQEKQTLSPEMKKKLDTIIDNYLDIFSKDQYYIGVSINLPIEIPTEGPPCMIPLKFRPWPDNNINKLLEAGMIQYKMSTWASPVIIIPKKGLELPKDPGTPLPVTAKLRLVCDYRKLKIESVKKWKKPHNAKTVRKFLGFVNYYRKFIKDYSKIARSLYDLVSGENAKRRTNPIA